MLADAEEELDDTHLCIKCSTTVIGLENYIKHRKSLCSTTKLINKTMPSSLSTPAPAPRTSSFATSVTITCADSAPPAVVVVATPTFPIINNKNSPKLKPSSDEAKNPISTSRHHPIIKESSYAGEHGTTDDEEEEEDDSFSNTSKSKSLDKSLESFSFNYDLIESPVTRSEVVTPSNTMVNADFRKPNHNPPPPSENLMDNYDLGADLFFTSLQLSSKRKFQSLTSSSVDNKEARQDLIDDWIPHHSPHIERPSTSKKLDTPIFHMDRQLADISEDSDDENLVDESDFDLDEDEDDEDDEEEDYHRPPRTHTGGKWKPEHRPEPNLITNRWNETKNQTTANEEMIGDDYVSYFTPPQNHTQGKWVPGSKIKKIDYKPVETKREGVKEKNSRLEEEKLCFWCNTCNRKLASRIIYERHLKSNLHIKRSQPEKELAEGTLPSPRLLMSSPNLEENRKNSPNSSRRSSANRKANVRSGADNQIYSIKASVSAEQSALIKGDAENPRRKFTTAPTPATNTNLNAGAEVKPKLNQRREKSKRIRRKIYIRCEVCKLRLPVSYMGKHLISHFHYRRMHLNWDKSRAMVPEHLDMIIKQSPYQCQPCQFYTITQQLFLQHFISKSHKINIEEKKIKTMWCSFCKFESSTQEMLNHLLGSNHKEVVMAFNRSVPIIIRELVILKCQNCSQTFRYNIQIKQHFCKPIKDEPTSSKTNIRINTASDSYQSRYTCEKCGQIYRKKKALSNHLFSVHQIKQYFCTPCDLTFFTKSQVLKHRSSANHKINANKKPNLKQCKHCLFKFPNIIELKTHLKNVHPEMALKCLRCGEKFTVAQDLGRHTRDKKCRALKSEETAKLSQQDNPLSQIRKCVQCPFQSESEADLIFHNTLHKFEGSSPIGAKFKLPCEICGKTFGKNSLLCHLRKHKNERIFQCGMCSKSYPRKHNLIDHLKTHEKDKLSSANPAKEPLYKCQSDDCKFSTDNPSKFKEHRDQHEGKLVFKCNVQNCTYEGSSSVNLKKHQKIHSVENFTCLNCGFSTRTMSYLKKHLILHEEEKNYKCPHCEFQTRTSANLRKHILSATKHEGKFMYNCECGQFQTNYEKELKKHNIECQLKK